MTLRLAVLAFAAAGLAPMPRATPAQAPAGVFAFGAAGDFDGPGLRSLATLGDAVKDSGASFLLALGDLGYTTDERGWCSAIKSHFNDVEIIVGNHDTAENGPGRIARSVVHCPFTIAGVTVHAGPKTPGYGYEYYFDYPAAKPLARFILIAPGIGGEVGYRFGTGSSHYKFTAQAIADARTDGIPWVIAAMHKNCLTTGTGHVTCETGVDVQNLFFTAGVDLVLNAHEHNYERSKQLTCADLGRFRPACVASAGPGYVKGAGTVIVTQGTASEFYPISRPISPYFAAAQDRETGFVAYTVSATTLSGRFISTSGRYTDSFTIVSGRPLQ